MFEIPGLDTMNTVMQMTSGLGALAPAAGMAQAQGWGELAGGAWDFGSDAIANIGSSFDPAMLGGPFMPGAGGDEEMKFGLVDDRLAVDGAIADYSPSTGVQGATAEYSPGKESFSPTADATADFSQGKDAFY